MTVSEYLLQSAEDIATEEILSPEQIILNEQERDAFISAIKNPPEISPKLKAAIKEYQEEYGKW